MLYPSRRRTMAIWLLVCCAAVFVMVILGGVTRLTHSGLSMVEWKPLTILPPLSEAQWQITFAQYQQFPEYKLRNVGMTLSEFQGIFWLEYVHRLWGRGIGVIFFAPFAWFLARNWIDKALGFKLGAILVLGGMQGLVGWLMVKSGLVNHPEVSQYRLTGHLALAVVIYGSMFWLALGLLRPLPTEGTTPITKKAAALVVLVFVTILSGGFVAGLKAGLGYNTFPLMNGQLVPDGIFLLEPFIINLFENPATVQFDHRILATTTGLLIILLWGFGRHLVSGRARLALNVFGGMAMVQIGLGISTLLLLVPVSLAAAHQAGALLLFTFGLWLVQETRPQ